jgi:predicted  nucleic acid-binding Zn-ribbon protein
MAKEIKITIEDLARMINNMDQRIDKKFGEVNKTLNETNNNVKGLKSDIYDLKEGQRRIEDRLNNVAYKFEIKSIEKRVSALES